MLRGTTVLLGTFTLISSAVGAQLPAARTNRAPAPRQTSRAAAPRIAGIAPAPVAYQPPAIPTTGLFTNITSSPGLFSNVPTTQQSVVPQPVSLFLVPAVLLSDGRIFANFDGVYEEVLRQCPAVVGTTRVAFVAPACWVVDPAGRYRVLRQR